MQRSHTVPPTPAERPAPRAPTRAAADVPSDQLWRQAIQATREAAASAAELRRALAAPRGGAGPS
jgi:hypothetical protein